MVVSVSIAGIPNVLAGCFGFEGLSLYDPILQFDHRLVANAGCFSLLENRRHDFLQCCTWKFISNEFEILIRILAAYMSHQSFESILAFRDLNGGWAGSRTQVHGFAGRCIATLPPSRCFYCTRQAWSGTKKPQLATEVF